jgi:trimeric autotransporter adhesin
MPFMVSAQIFGYNSLVNDNSNVALGLGALQNNTRLFFGNDSRVQGVANTAVGIDALHSNIHGCCNTAVGWKTLFSNKEGYENTAIGDEALTNNTSGFYNTAMGSGLSYNTTGSYNTSCGNSALYENTKGSKNTSMGFKSLKDNTTGNRNTALGNHAGSINKTGSFNTYLGDSTDATADSFSNSTAIGYFTRVNASNKVRIGNSAITVIEGQVAWSHPSDRRLKENIVYTKHLGLDFINQLQTVSYSYKSDKAKTYYDGFIAQDVEEAMKKFGVKFSGLKKSDDGMYSLAYSDFVMPLVNAVKELTDKNGALEKRIIDLESLIARIAPLKNHVINGSVQEKIKSK